MENWNAFQNARNRAEGKLTFYAHLIVYLVVSILLISRNLGTAPQYPWTLWPVLVWSLGVLFHGVVIFVFRANSILTERMIERELRLSKAEIKKLHEEPPLVKPIDPDQTSSASSII